MLLNKKIKSLLKGKDNILAKGLGSILIRIIGALSSYALSYLIAKQFGPEGNGVFALFLTYTIILSTFFYLGLDIFLVKQVSVLLHEEKENEIKRLHSNILKKYIAPITIFLIFSGSCLSFFYNEILIFIVACGISFNVFIDINSATLRGMKKAEWFSFFNQFSKFFLAVILFMLPFFNDYVHKALWVYLISLLINGVLSFLILKMSLKGVSFNESLNVDVSKFSIGFLFNSSKEFFFSSIIIITLVWVDFIFINIFLDDTNAGIYSVALKLSTLVSFGFTAFNAFLAPKISELYSAKNVSELQQILNHNFLLVLPLLLVPFLIILFFSHQLLGLFGREFESGYIVLLLLASGQLINGLFGPVSLLLQMTNHQKVFQNILILAFVIKITCAFGFIKILGIEGIALASLIGLTVWTILGSLFVYKKVGVYSWIKLKKVK